MATNMESVHGVDVSWSHHPQKENQGRARALSSPAPATTPTKATKDAPKTNVKSTVDDQILPVDPKAAAKPDQSQSAGATPQPAASSVPPSPNPSTETSSKSLPKRPNALNKGSNDKSQGDQGKSPSRRPSWINNLSSKFSSTPQQQTQGGQPAQQQQQNAGTTSQPSGPQVSKTNATSSPRPDQGSPQVGSQPGYKVEAEELQPYVPQKPRESTGSFFSSLTRRLSSGSQGGAGGKLAETGGVCPRKIMNVDPNRERCLVPELDAAKLRRVSFSVDVEIAAGPKYKDDDSAPLKQTKSKDKKLKDKAEGEALKHPQAATEIKDEKDATDASVDEAVAKTDTNLKESNDDTSVATDPKGTSHKKEKKKKSEEERKERKEKKRKKAEENGSIPVELTREDSNVSDEPTPADDAAVPPTPATPAKPQENPTTDPVRIYRRCCQLRESPILKRITEQLMSPTCTLPTDPGTVTCLNLKNSRLQLPDFVTLGDWLAIVPVKRLILEDADITDEGLRVVLAGLLSAKKPQPTKLRKTGEQTPTTPREERTGIVEKLTLKNNPRITRSGWKHLALFLYMCRSVRAVDLSMNKFPSDLPPSVTNTPTKAPQRNPVSTGSSVDAAETFYKALAERLGGSTLQELNMSECELNTNQLRKIVDGATVCGVTRLGLAGNYLNEEGFEHVLSYIRSGVCTAIDIGSNDFRGKLGQLAAALDHKTDCPVWGLSLVNCNLDTEALKELLPALTRLKEFKFLDISHNKDLFENDAAGGIHLLRKFIPKLRNLIRLHLLDVGMSAKQAIALAEVLPEGPRLAHFNILENADITALASKTDEVSQEEACALYASLMAAARVSPALVCIDVDVPSAENSEVVKALAKQVVAYTLRNMERSPFTQGMNIAEQIKANDESQRDEISVPDVLVHLVGHVDGFNENHDNDDPAPDDDYIVGGNGVVKALQYVLGETSQDLRRGSGIVSGTSTPKERDSGVGRDMARKGKAKEMSKSLLDSARKIRNRLRPALLKEAAAGDEMAYRRLMFLDSTLERMIDRFEDEFPETRLEPGSPRQAVSDLGSSVGTLESAPLTDAMSVSANTTPNLRKDSNTFSDEDDEDARFAARASRHNSDVTMAGRALALEEGRIHRLGQGLRRDIMNAPSASNSNSALDLTDPAAASSSAAAQTGVGQVSGADEETEKHLADLAKKIESMDGLELRDVVDRGGWNMVMEKIGANIEELRQLQEKDPVGWEQFKESQMKARLNVGTRSEL